MTATAVRCTGAFIHITSCIIWEENTAEREKGRREGREVRVGGREDGAESVKERGKKEGGRGERERGDLIGKRGRYGWMDK